MSIIIKPIITEKSTTQKQEGKYVFKVSKDANKIQIKQELHRLFGVKAISINTVSVKGKIRRRGKTTGQLPDWKKAIVVLAEGQKIEIFDKLI